MPSAVRTLSVSGADAVGSTFLGQVKSQIDLLVDAAVLPLTGVAGTSAAYTAAVSPALTTLTEGNAFWFEPHVACVAAPTLKIGATPAVALYRATGVPLKAGDMAAGRPYLVTYRATDAALSLPPRFVVLAVLGTMAAQDADAVAIAGGTAALDALTVPELSLDGAAGTFRQIIARSAGTPRMVLRLADNGAESGGNAGSDTRLIAYSDAGGVLSTPARFERSTGKTYLAELVLTTKLAVSEGGTGGSTQATARAGLGLGSMATQDAATVAIGGGTAVLSALTVGANAASSAQIDLNGAAGTVRRISGRTGGVLRWAVDIATSDPETGGNAGSSFLITRYADGSGYIGTPLNINRATGLTTLEALSVTGAIQQGGTDVINATRIPVMRSYTVATLPSASANARGLIYVSDGVSNKRLAISDGTNWRWPDGAVVS